MKTKTDERAYTLGIMAAILWASDMEIDGEKLSSDQAVSVANGLLRMAERYNKSEVSELQPVATFPVKVIEVEHKSWCSSIDSLDCNCDPGKVADKELRDRIEREP